MATSSKNRLERLKQQREKLDARIQATESRLKNSERKKDTRRKILIGAYYLDMDTKENTTLFYGLSKIITFSNPCKSFHETQKTAK